jgi:hypothetical protein
MYVPHAQPSPLDRSGAIWREVGEETEWWIGSGDAPDPDVTVCSAFQPIFRIPSCEVAGTEALLRAYLHDGAQISPPVMFARRSASEAVSLDALVTDRRNRAGDDRHNEATRSGPETRFRRVSRMRFFAGFGNRIFGAFRHRFGLAEALALDDDAIGAMA